MKIILAKVPGYLREIQGGEILFQFGQMFTLDS